MKKITIEEHQNDVKNEIIIHKFMNLIHSMSPADRLEIFECIAEHICFYCGDDRKKSTSNVRLPCQCRNDE